MTTTDDLLDMSVDDQKNELENLDREQLKELRSEEERSTALDNIDRQLNKKNSMTQQSAKNQDQESYDYKDKVQKLEAKVDYLIERCKTTNKEGFENYEN